MMLRLLLLFLSFCLISSFATAQDYLSEELRGSVEGLKADAARTPSESEDQYTFERYADDAVKLLQHFGYEKSIVWSMAWGSRAAVVYAARHPECPPGSDEERRTRLRMGGRR